MWQHSGQKRSFVMLIRICIFYPELETSGSALRRLQSAMRKRHQQLIASLLMGMFCMTTSYGSSSSATRCRSIR